MPLKVIVACHTAVILALLSWAPGQDQPVPNPASQTPLFKIGKDVSPPRAIYAPDPEFSEKARSKHHQGTCVIMLVVGEDGKTRNIRVIKPLGMGLDEKAIEAVRSWRFDPARKDGKPVAVEIAAEIDFHLYGSNDRKITELTGKAAEGDANAELELSTFYFKGRDIEKDEDRGMMYLQSAARHGLPKAQFLMGERMAHLSDPDYPRAYLWYMLAERAGYKHSHEKLQELTKKMTSEQMQVGQALVEKWPDVTAK